MKYILDGKQQSKNSEAMEWFACDLELATQIACNYLSTEVANSNKCEVLHVAQVGISCPRDFEQNLIVTSHTMLLYGNVFTFGRILTD